MPTDDNEYRPLKSDRAQYASQKEKVNGRESRVPEVAVGRARRKVGSAV